MADSIQTFEEPASFDAAAATYDERFSNTCLGRWLRQQVWKRLHVHFKPGQRILELGCGTGEDAIWLAKKGIHVTATDRSGVMLEMLKQKTDRLHLHDFIQTEFLDLNHPWEKTDRFFDGVFANFGVLNCVEDCRHLSRFLGHLLKPEAAAIFVMMNPICPWEIGSHLLHGRVKDAFRRFGGQPIAASVAEDTTVQVRYPLPAALAKEFRPQFRMQHLQGLGVLLPPSYFSETVEKHRKFFTTCNSLEQKIADIFPCTRLNDHYILELIRL